MANPQSGRPPAWTSIVNPNSVLNSDQLLEELENATHRNIVEETQADIIEWLVR